LVLSCLAYTFSEKEQSLAFVSFMKTFYKKYNSQREMMERFEIFKQSLVKIDKLRSTATSAVFGITQFSDLTSEEFKEMYMMKKKIDTPTPRNSDDVLQPIPHVAPPTTFDWRTKGAVTPIKDQKQCGSCWAFSVVENVESMWILAKNASSSTLRLSEQQVVDCDNEDDGCDGGDPPSAYKYIISAGGLEGEQTYPYTARDGSCKFKSSNVVAKISSWKYACSSKDETTLQNNLVSWGPVSICVDAEYWQYYQSGVMTAWECAWINQLDHCVLLVGYDATATTPYWIVRNSWGTGWGVNGYIYLSMQQNTCGMTEEATTSVV